MIPIRKALFSAHGRWPARLARPALRAALLAFLCLVISDPASGGTDQITWPGSPTPVTFSNYEISITSNGRLFSWCGVGERLIQGYRVQARAPGGDWRLISPLIEKKGGGPEGNFYAWLYQTNALLLEYRLTEISRGGFVLPIDETDPDVQRRKKAEEKKKCHAEAAVRAPLQGRVDFIMPRVAQQVPPDVPPGLSRNALQNTGLVWPHAVHYFILLMLALFAFYFV